MQSKFPIGWIFSIIAALAIAVLTFFSSNFQHQGNSVGISILMAAIILICMLVIVFFMVRVKKAAIPLNFHKAAIIEAILLLTFIFMAFISILATNHFYAVMGRKDAIQKEVKAQISQMDEMFSDYNKNVVERVDAYDKELASIEKNKKNNNSAYVNAGLSQYSREDLVVLFRSEISCGDMQASIEQWENDMLSKTTGLGLIRLMPRIHEIDETLNNTVDELRERDRKSELGLNGPHWDYTLTIGNNILRHFEKEQGEKLNLWALIIAIIAAFIMLLPYIAADRDGRNRGLIWELSHNRESSSTNDGGVIGGI